VAELCARHPRHFLPSQYANPDNPASYRPLADHLAATVGPVDCLVGPVGSGGSMCGTASFLRAGPSGPQMQAVGVDTPGSVLFGHADAPRLVRGLGNSVMPANLNHRTFDEVHWLPDREAFAATRTLHRQHAVYMGPTSGAAWLVASWWARLHPDSRVVTLLPDEGHRYQDTVYDDRWLESRDMRLPLLPTEPEEVTAVTPARHWSFLRWDRRSFDDVTGPAR
jgi:cysteine synthase A